MFTKKDLVSLQKCGINQESAEKQLDYLRSGQHFRKLHQPATLEQGILAISDKDKTKYLQLFEKARSKNRCAKFVPASGAATRMFKVLFEAKKRTEKGDTIHDLLVSDDPDNAAFREFMKKMEHFAFFTPLKALLKQWGYKIQNIHDLAEITDLFDAILSPAGLNFGELPKGLIPFHLEPSGKTRTAFEEHLLEAAELMGKGLVHFTVSPKHQTQIQEHLSGLAKDLGLTISYSIQDPATDTVALTHSGEPARDAQGHLILRPGGHGALIANLDAMQGDMVFIKNIDNVVKRDQRASQVEWKKILGGVLLETEQKLAQLKQRLDQDAPPELAKELSSVVGIKPPKSFGTLNEVSQRKWLEDKINRPIRVCGMVENVGEPGGGPFWIDEADGTQSLQIVEKAEINIKDSVQKEHMNRSTHFNPVDLVVSLRDGQGNLYDLNNYVDQDSYFISEKSHQGQALKALEWPGLWNGAMANWNTVFVEVPLDTFNPVKEVLDLLRPSHTS